MRNLIKRYTEKTKRHAPSFGRTMLAIFFIFSVFITILFTKTFSIISQQFQQELLYEQVDLTVKIIRNSAINAASSSNATEAELVLNALNNSPLITYAQITDPFGQELAVIGEVNDKATDSQFTIRKTIKLKFNDTHVGELRMYFQAKEPQIDSFMSLSIGFILFGLNITILLALYQLILHYLLKPIRTIAEKSQFPPDDSIPQGIKAITEDKTENAEYIFKEFNDIANSFTQRFNQLHSLAIHDGLTGLLNRRAFELELSQALEKEQDIALFLIDLDYLKYYNDAFSHHVGDEFIRHVSEQIKSICDESLTGYRLGGDEFALLYQGNAPVEPIFNKIDKQRKTKISVEGFQTLPVSFSLACIHAKSKELQKTKFITVGYELLSQAKTTGESTIHEVTKPQKAHKTMPYELMKSILINADLYHLQPIVNAKTLQNIGCEILLRVPDSSSGNYFSPEAIIMSCERYNLLDELTRSTLKYAYKAIAWAHSHGHKEFRISINLNLEQLTSIYFWKIMKEVFLVSNDAEFLSKLNIELHENDYLDSQAFRRIKSKLEKHNVRFAIDDFGKGHASLARLLQISAQYVKLDRSLLNMIPRGPTLLRLMAKALSRSNRIVIFEGVETHEQLEFVRTCGDVAVQGFFISKALSFEHWKIWMQNAAPPMSKNNDRPIKPVPRLA